MPAKRIIPPDLRARIVASYNRGNSLQVISFAYDLDVRGVRQVLVEEGVEIRGKGGKEWDKASKDRETLGRSFRGGLRGGRW